MSTTTAHKPKRSHRETVEAEIAEAAEAENLLALTVDQAEKIYQLQRVKADLAKLRHEDAALSAEVKGWLDGYEGATLMGKLLASISHRAGRRVVDWDLLAVKFPKAYAKCVSKGEEVAVLHVHK